MKALISAVLLPISDQAPSVPLQSPAAALCKGKLNLLKAHLNIKTEAEAFASEDSLAPRTTTWGFQLKGCTQAHTHIQSYFSSCFNYLLHFLYELFFSC